MKKLLFAINPYAGTRKATKVLAEILSVFNRAGYDTRVYITAGPGDLTRRLPELVQEGILTQSVRLSEGYLIWGLCFPFLNREYSFCHFYNKQILLHQGYS